MKQSPNFIKCDQCNNIAMNILGIDYYRSFWIIHIDINMQLNYWIFSYILTLDKCKNLFERHVNRLEDDLFFTVVGSSISMDHGDSLVTCFTTVLHVHTVVRPVVVLTVENEQFLWEPKMVQNIISVQNSSVSHSMRDMKKDTILNVLKIHNNAICFVCDT